MSAEKILIRPAKDADVSSLVLVEEGAWTGLGTEIYTAAHFEIWLAVHPQSFWVAECQGSVVGYVYGQAIDFSTADLPAFTSCNAVTDHGYTKKTHRPEGKTLYGVSLASVKTGAGKLLIKRLYGLMTEGRFTQYIGCPRLAGLADYLNWTKGNSRYGILSEEEAEIALWYTMECAKMADFKVWPQCGRQPRLNLPKPNQVDPLLGFHMRNWGVPNMTLGILKVMPNFMQDPQSRNCAALICAGLPELE